MDTELYELRRLARAQRPAGRATDTRPEPATFLASPPAPGRNAPTPVPVVLRKPREPFNWTVLLGARADGRLGAAVRLRRRGGETYASLSAAGAGIAGH